MSFHSVVIQKLLSTNSHIGRHVTSHHFKIFSSGTRNSISITDADKTLICLRNACNFIGHLSRNPHTRFIFVNTNPLLDEIISHLTRTIGIKNDTTWRLGGFLTNSSSPRKFRGRNKKFNLGVLQPPDCIVLFDSDRKSSVIQEASKLQIPIVGLVDSSMPWETYKKISYPVPGNDSVEFVYLFCNLIAKTILKEKMEVEGNVKGEEVETSVDVEDLTLTSTKKFVFPYENLPAIPEDIKTTKQLLDKLVIVKYNGSLGTKIGFNGPKSLVGIGGDLTCLDLTINQIEALNGKYGCNIPLLLVNAINTHDSTLKVMEKHSNKNIHYVIQSERHLEKARSFAEPLANGQNNLDEMDSFNLAEVFLPLMSSGMLENLLLQGKEYILLLSSDNLAHVVDPKILDHLMQNNIQFCLEMMSKTSEIEEKELSPNEENLQILTPKENWKFIDTVWVNINSIKSLVERSSGKDHLTISKLFDQHFALSVPKSRYLPVEATSDLFLLQSDLYTLKGGILIRNTARENSADPSIQLGLEFENVNDFHRRFKSIPSVLELESLNVTGDVWFGANITLKGKVRIHANQDTTIVIPDGAVLENKIITSQGDVGGGFS